MTTVGRIAVALLATIVLAQFVHGLLAVAIGLLGFGIWSLVQRGKQTRESLGQEYGLSAEEKQAIEDDLAAGDKESAVRILELARDRRHASLRDQGIDVDAIAVLIGKDIKWSDITRQVFRVLDFDRAGTRILEDETVEAKSSLTPYGYLLVESPILNLKARLPIVHRDDFTLATIAFDDAGGSELAAQAELLVTYYPERRLPGASIGIHHGLHYVYVPRGTLERYYDFNFDEHMRNPAPEKLFKQFAWTGDLGVGVNLDPAL